MWLQNSSVLPTRLSGPSRVPINLVWEYRFFCLIPSISPVSKVTGIVGHFFFSKMLTKNNWHQCFEYEKLWNVLVHFRGFSCANFLNIRRKSGVTWKDMIDISNFWVCDLMTGPCLGLLFFEQTIDSCCSISKSVNHISDHGLKCLSACIISTGKSECVTKFWFASKNFWTNLHTKSPKWNN